MATYRCEGTSIKLLGDNYNGLTIDDCNFILDNHQMDKICNEYGFYDTSIHRLKIEMKPGKKIKKMSGMFSSCTNLLMIDLSQLDTSEVEDMGLLFFNCSNLAKIDGLDTLETLNVNNMQFLFYGCLKLKSVEGVEYWDVRKVKNMFKMFSECSATYVSITSWNIEEKDEEFYNMFKDADYSEEYKGTSGVDRRGMFYAFGGHKNINGLDNNYYAVYLNSN